MKSCDRRERTGDCDHEQCPYSYATSHSRECVDFYGINFGGEAVVACEMSGDEGCPENCEFNKAQVVATL